MRVMIGTPCGGGQATTQYLLSMLETYNSTAQHRQAVARQFVSQVPGFNQAQPDHARALQDALIKHSYDIGLYTLAGESLLQRGRNHIAQVAISQAWDKLMFIDADAGWTWPQLETILKSPHPITAGLCPLKMYPISLNYLPFQEDELHFEGGIRTLESTKALAKAKGSPIFEVPFVGTAFLCIDTKVFREMAETCDHYIYPDPHTGEPQSHWDFFKVESVNNTFLSEDWSFCHRARQMGYKVYVNSDVIISHTGNHTFKAV